MENAEGSKSGEVPHVRFRYGLYSLRIKGREDKSIDCSSSAKVVKTRQKSDFGGPGHVQ